MAGQHHWTYVVEEQGHHSLPCVLSEIAAGTVAAHGSASAPSLQTKLQSSPETSAGIGTLGRYM